MSTSYNAQICTERKEFCIQFDTDQPDLYRLVEQACRDAIDEADRRRKEHL